MRRLVCLGLLLAAVAGVIPQDATPVVLVPDAAPTTEAPLSPPETCVNLPVHECPPLDQPEDKRIKTLCRRVGVDSLICCYLHSMFDLKEQVARSNLTDIKSLHVRNATLPELDANFTNNFRVLESLSITDGNITKILGQFHPSITCLNLSGNVLTDIHDEALGPLTNLNNLDISRNNLTQLPTFNVSSDDFWLDVSGTNQLPCSKIQDIIALMSNSSSRLHFSHKNNSFCNIVAKLHWFNHTEKLPLAQLEHQSKLLQACPRGKNFNCTCNIHRIDIVEGLHPSLTVAVNCSGQQLTELPENLPEGTVILNVSRNNISNINLLATGEKGYNKIREFFGDDNSIVSIRELEGSDFINSFNKFSIKNNFLSSIPTYFLSSRFDRSGAELVRVHLGGNKVFCDCATIQLKDWLISNQNSVPDYAEVICSNMQSAVVDLLQTNVCVDEHVWTDYIYYIIAGEVALLMMLVAKVSYDYWVFKTAGYLPWPASEMPKLPCDWVFET